LDYPGICWKPHLTQTEILESKKLTVSILKFLSVIF
jgi:hypothetical protein